MPSECEPWRTAPEPSSSHDAVTSTTHIDFDTDTYTYTDTDSDTDTTLGRDEALDHYHLEHDMPDAPSTPSSTSSPTCPSSARVASMPELSRSTSTVNPSTPSTIYFPRMGMDLHTLSRGDSNASGSLFSLRETLADDDKAVIIDRWQHGRVVYHDGRTHRSVGSNREVIVFDEDDAHQGHANTPDVPHDHEHESELDLSGSSTAADAGDWEDIETNTKLKVVNTADEVGAEAEVETNEPPAWTTAIPTVEDVRDASGCHLIDQWGNAVRFGDMLPGGPAWRSATLAGKPVTKVLALFVGHWWCGLCHDYAVASVSKLSPAALIREGVRVVIISSGSWKVIAKYRQLFNIKFPVFVDNGTRLYHALGLPKTAPNPFSEAMMKNRPSYHQHAFARQMATGMARGIFQLGGIKLRNPGNFMQLGGEFVFGLDNSCHYAHRMQGRGDHCEAPDILTAVGVQSSLGAPISNFDREREDVRRRIHAGEHLE